MTARKGSTLPPAPPSIAAVIDRLAVLRAEAREIQRLAKPLAARIVKYGKSCQSARWTAYISHVQGGMKTYYRAPSCAVKIKPRRV